MVLPTSRNVHMKSECDEEKENKILYITELSRSTVNKNDELTSSVPQISYKCRYGERNISFN